MFAVEVNRENYEYDIQALVKSFYPGEQVAVLLPESRADKRRELEDKVRIRLCVEAEAVELTVDGRASRWTKPPGEDFKGGLKRFLYEVLSRETGRSLPWGNLIGIRPVKIACGLLEDGCSRQEIIEHYCREHYTSVEKAELAVDIAQRERKLLADVHSRDGYSLYIGIPFCPTTCLYCSFTSYPIGGYREMVDAYLDCLTKEIEYVAKCCGNRTLDSEGRVI